MRPIRKKWLGQSIDGYLVRSNENTLLPSINERSGKPKIRCQSRSITKSANKPIRAGSCAASLRKM